jgi:hypothetical protein
VATRLDKVLQREIDINGAAHIVRLSPLGLKLTMKGRRNGLELAWADLVSGEAALAAALNASLGAIGTAPAPPPVTHPGARGRRRGIPQ